MWWMDKMIQNTLCDSVKIKSKSENQNNTKSYDERKLS